MSDNDPKRAESQSGGEDSADARPAEAAPDGPPQQSPDNSGPPAEPSPPSQPAPTAAPSPSEEPSTEPPGRMEDFWQRAFEHPHMPSSIKRIAKRKRNAAYAEQTVRYFAKNDPAVNAATRLPSTEQALVPVIWLAEVFTPTTIENLVKGLRDLSAKTTDSFGDSKEDPGDWILSSRRQGGRAVYNLPIVTTKGRGLLGPTAVDQLPLGIDFIQPWLHSLTSTVTVLTLAFRLKDSSACELAEILRRDLATRAQFNPGGSFTLLEVMRQKADAVDDWRVALRQEAAHWIAQRFPGFFCKIAPEQLPTIELLLTQSYTPWEHATMTGVPDWVKVLDLATWSGYWQAKDVGALRMNPRSRHGQRHFFTLAAPESELRGLDGVGASTGDLNESLGRLDLSIPFFLARWSLTALLEELEEQMPSIQDAADRMGRDNSPRTLAQVQRQLLRAGLDSKIVANDIVRFTEHPWWKYSVPDFTEILPPSFGPRRKPAVSLAEVLKQGQVADGRRVAQLETDLREVLGTNAELASASANLRLQRAVFWLAIVSLIVATVAAVAAVIAIWHPSTSGTTPSPQVTNTPHSSSPPPSRRH